MIVIQLTPVATVRIWFNPTLPAIAWPNQLVEGMNAAAESPIGRGHVTLEALVPRGGRAEYGLIGVGFQPDLDAELQIIVPYSGIAGPAWVDSLGNGVDDVKLGLPVEYALPVLEVAKNHAPRWFRAGTLKVVEAAHGSVGSSADFFQRLVFCALTILHDKRRREEPGMTPFLREFLVNTSGSADFNTGPSCG